MKKVLLLIIGFTLGSVAVLAALVNRWCQTPHGRLHPYMAIILQLMKILPIRDVASGDLERVRWQMDQTRPRIPLAKIEDTHIPGLKGSIPVRIYTPHGSGPFPTMVYYHGGGFVSGSLQSHDNVARQLSRDTGSIVISVDYRLAPEYPFPASVEDAYFGLLWAAENAPNFNGRPDQLLVVGDSAGGNLAAVDCLLAREENGPAIRMQILLYPSMTFLETRFPSRDFFAGNLLTEEIGRHIRAMYLTNEADWSNPYASPLEASDFSNLPPAYVMTAAFDPLRDEGKMYADCLAEAGVPVMYRNMEGMLHGFLSLADNITAVPGASYFFPQPDQVYADIRQMMDQIFSD